MAKIAVRWLHLPRLEYFDDFGAVTTESAIRGALAASADRNGISGFELKIKKSQLGTQPEFRGETVRFAVVDGARQAHLWLTSERVQGPTDAIPAILKQREAFLVRMQKQVWQLDSHHIWELAGAGRAASRPLYGLAMVLMGLIIVDPPPTERSRPKHKANWV